MYDENNLHAYEIVPYRKRKSLGFGKLIAVCLVAVCLGGSFGLGLGMSGALRPQEQTAARELTVAAENIGAVENIGAATLPQAEAVTFLNALPVSASGSVVDVVRKSATSVVSINITGTTRVFNWSQPFESAGSGIIIGEDSTRLYIATNNHVIQNATSVTVSVDDSKQVAANYLGSDFESDLAVISVMKTAMAEAGVTGYKIASTGDSDKLEVGEIVVAIGNALGEGKTATMGIISATDKEINIDSRSIGVLQTDAAINPGNSGGALVNMNAEVVGINTAKLSEVGVEGMGYSIPINEAKTIIDRLIKNGAPESRPYLGIQGVDVDEELRAANNLPSTGVYIHSVLSGSAAEAAGLRRGDLISIFGDKQLTCMEDLQTELARHSAGDVVELTVYRNGSKATAKVTLKDANQKF